MKIDLDGYDETSPTVTLTVPRDIAANLLTMVQVHGDDFLSLHETDWVYNLLADAVAISETVWGAMESFK